MLFKSGKKKQFTNPQCYNYTYLLIRPAHQFQKERNKLTHFKSIHPYYSIIEKMTLIFNRGADFKISKGTTSFNIQMYWHNARKNIDGLSLIFFWPDTDHCATLT